MSQLVIETHQGSWVIPEHFEFVKLMILQHQIQASDLCFSSAQECQRFARRLSLLALQDECQYREPSIIAELTRSLIAKSSIEAEF